MCKELEKALTDHQIEEEINKGLLDNGWTDRRMDVFIRIFRLGASSRDGEVEKLKCCGNCKHNRNGCMLHAGTLSIGHCSQWESKQ